MEASTSEAFSDVEASHSDSESEASEVNVSEEETVNVNSLLDRLKCPKPSDCNYSYYYTLWEIGNLRIFG